ncbi:5-oxoprolinase subunit PxpA [Chitinilyticum aquatile]|uniref:5-oxoprolinase subunit PxpA n=1 Tax=Chitinilyticum aquatile TaxID=362520 RepID=UPI0004001789|nr:5-oxoprolinase subunit PxpA [Chitinilyticum aquatile]
MFVDLNSDLGEGCGQDAALIPLLSSANIACGGHAGSDVTMRATVALALRHGVVIGAHPSYPDRAGFGRQALVMSQEDLQASLVQQLQALQRIAAAQGAGVRYVKPHGALYNEAMHDAALAAQIIAAAQGVLGAPAIMGQPGSVLLRQAAAAGLQPLAEGFADRAYQADGSLRPRSQPGAVLDDAAALDQVRAFVLHQQVRSYDGKWVKCRIDSLCLHGDNPSAVRQAVQIRGLLDELSVEVKSSLV